MKHSIKALSLSLPISHRSFLILKAIAKSNIEHIAINLKSDNYRESKKGSKEMLPKMKERRYT